MAKKRNEQLPIGTRIKFLQAIHGDDPDEACLYADEGDRGEVVGHDNEAVSYKGHWVKVDRDDYEYSDFSFAAELGTEFALIQEPKGWKA